MSIWSRIAEAIAALTAGEGLAAVFDKLRSAPEHSVGFTIAVVALGAKMAKADGLVTRDEVAAFREIFVIPPEDEKNAARVFNLARQDVAGFEDYARRIASMFNHADHLHHADATLYDLIEGLFYIAVADGNYHELEDTYLARVADIFGLSDRDFKGLRARFVTDAEPDPFDVLGVEPGTPTDEVRAAWRQMVRDSHPDRMMARGVPEEAIRMAEKRLIAINRAWEKIQATYST